MDSTEKSKSSFWSIGGISLIFAILGMMSSFSYINNISFGQIFLKNLNIKTPVSMFSLILFLPSIYMAYKHPKNYFAKEGGIFSLLFIVTMVMVTLLTFIFN